MYTNKPRTLDELKEAITQEVAILTPEMLSKAFDSFCARLEECLIIEEHHLKDVELKTLDFVAHM